jgi:hypothetical protein
MRSELPIVVLLVLAAGGCGARSGLPQGADLHAPAPTDWSARPAGRLWPDGARAVQMIVSAGRAADELYAWGVVDGRRVAWAYRLRRGDLGALVDQAARDAVAAAPASPLDGVSWILAGSILLPPPPPPPGPGGVPEDYVRALLRVAHDLGSRAAAGGAP